MGLVGQTGLGAFWTVRRHTERLCEHLTAEDQIIQSMPDASPAKWHRAHTTWFFEQFILLPTVPGYVPFSAEFSYLFNSYYESVGARHPRFARGMITRPGAAEVTEYRAHVDAAMAELLASGADVGDLLALGLQHEQQHQELLLTDMLHGFSQNPLSPAMIPLGGRRPRVKPPMALSCSTAASCPSATRVPASPSITRPLRIRCCCSLTGWPTDSFATGHGSSSWPTGATRRRRSGCPKVGLPCSTRPGRHPLHWRERDGTWSVFTTAGETELDPAQPVRHISWYEADAFARWAGARLPTEFEWEAASSNPAMHELSDHVWQWTGSAYLPYPGFSPPSGAIGEYNGKFMINQMVLRGGSMATPPGHTRPTYRNFFHPDRRVAIHTACAWPWLPDVLDSAQPCPPSVLDEVLEGLHQAQKTLPAKLFYDAEGCRLFGEITRLPEYYVTRTERKLLADIVPQLPKRPGSTLVEYGGSDEAKALLLLDQVGASTYVPIDVAADALQDMTDRLRISRPDLKVSALATDFLQPFALPASVAQQPKFGFFPGSTIGNLDPAAAGRFLRQARDTLGADAKFLVGVDLRKDPAILVPAYDDAQGVTAAFNRNLLVHLNRITGSVFDPLSFDHRAVWNEASGRIEMHLVSLHPQSVELASHTITFAAGEWIHTESSYKHTVDGFLAIARPAGWVSEAVWTDRDRMFSLHLLATREIVR